MSDDVGDIGSLSDCYVTQPNGKRALSVNSGGYPLDVMIRQAVTAVTITFYKKGFLNA